MSGWIDDRLTGGSGADPLGRALLDAVGQAVVAVDAGGRVLYLNAAAAALCGCESADAVGRPFPELLGPHNAAVAEQLSVELGIGVAASAEYTVSRQDGTKFPVAISASPVHDADGHLVAMVAMARDMSEQRAAIDAQVRFDAGFEGSPLGMVITDFDARPVRVNASVCRMLGWSAEQLLRWDLERRSGQEGGLFSPEEVASIRAGVGSHRDERRWLRPDGSVVWLGVELTQVRSPEEIPLFFLANFVDITARRSMEAELEHRSLHDDLTGLPNRVLLMDRLAQLMAVPRNATSTGLVSLDIDGFKDVNDALGHDAGDAMLLEVARRLSAACRPGATVARLGGDEFVVVCDDVTAEDMAALAEQIGHAMAAPWSLDGRRVDIRVSLGITISRTDSTGSRLISEADAAMFRAKELGRGRVAIFDDSLRERAVTRLEGERSLRVGLDRGEVLAWYQPIVNADSDRPVGVEALARWHTEDGGVLDPAEFVALAESTGLIVPLGQSVLIQATSAVAEWNRACSGPDLWVSVNLSARQLEDGGLLYTVRNALGTSGLDPTLLHLEITETILMADLSESIVVLEHLRQLGVHLSIDDFGTGYSSLARLKQLPVDVLKIDQSFVGGLGTDPDDTAIVEAIIGMAGALGLRCLAEGVETSRQREVLVDLRCEMAQGYFWSRPLDPAAARAWAVEAS